MALPAAKISIPFNGDNQDKSGNGNHLIPNGITFDAVNKHIGSHSALGDGINDFGEIADSPSLDAANIAIVSWVKFTSTTTGVIAERSNGTFGADDWTVFRIGGKIQTTMNIGGANRGAISPLLYNDDVFHNVVAMYDGAAVRLFVDKVYVAEVIIAGSLGASSDPITLFARKGPLFPFSKNIDAFVMYGQGVTYGGVSVGQTATGQIAEIFNNGTGIEPGVQAGSPWNYYAQQ